jgi:hypothetical protein
METLNKAFTFLIGVTVGIVLGYVLTMTDNYQNGRVSACKDMLKVDPVLRMLPLECVPYKDDAAIKVGDKLYSLDGQPLN